MKEIKGDFGERFIEISGGKKEIENIDEAIEKIEEIDESNETISQIFNAKKIAGESHLLHASKLALEALKRGESFANTPRIELTCWVAGLRQINKALDRVGVEEGSEKIAVVSIGGKKKKVKQAQKEIFQDLDIKEKTDALEITEDKINILKESFSISQKQLKVSSPGEIILEKVALLSLEQ